MKHIRTYALVILSSLLVFSSAYAGSPISAFAQTSSSLPTCDSQALPNINNYGSGVDVPTVTASGFAEPNGTPCNPTAAQQQVYQGITQTNSGVNSPVSCDGFWNYMGNVGVCFPRTVGTFLGTSIIWLASWVLTVAGLLFDWSISQTITQFGQFVNQNLINTINITWSAFRDISNIVIIGMFTFIAIATILGIEGYGYKKMLSRVLIVAVLINFSLLFTKIIIDVSNFTAVQFFAAAGSSIPAISQTAEQQSGSGASSVSLSSGTTASSGSGQPSDIAGAFMQYAGASSFGNTYTAISSIAQNQNQGGWIALTYGVVIGLLELVAALVLFYGTFLLIARALLMIFLMITSSIAFASYLIPSLSAGGYGFSAWMQSLLKNAVFAPLLAVLLWVTLTVAQGFHVSQNGAGSLGALIASPTASINISALFGYLVVIGLLFISFRISSSFASSVGGLSLGQDAWSRFANGAASLFSSGAGGAGGLLRRYGWERPAYGVSQRLTKEARDLSLQADRANQSGNEQLAKHLGRQALQLGQTASKLADRAGGYKKDVEARAKKVNAVLARTEPTAEQRSDDVKAAEALRRTARENAAELGKNLKDTQNQTKELAQTLKEQFDREIASNETLGKEHAKNLEDATRAAADENAKAMKPIEDRMKQLNDAISRGGISDAEHQRLQKQLLQTDEAHKSELRHQAERVERARQIAMIKTAGSSSASDALKKAAENLQMNHTKESDIQVRIEQANNIYQRTPDRDSIRSAQKATTNALIDQISAKQTGILGRTIGVDNDVANATRSKVKDSHETHGIQKALKEYIDKNASGEAGH